MGKVKKYILLILIILTVLTGSVKYLAHLISVSSNVNGRELPIHSVETNEKKVSLTFDVAWGNEDMPQLLEILAQHNIHATFFMTGEWVDKHPEDVKTIYEAGHDLGNHGANHKNMSQMSTEMQKDEIANAHEKVKEIVGLEMNLFRPPYGDYNDDVILSSQVCGYYAIQWDVDSLDWKDYGAESIIETVVDHKNLQNGSIILCHSGTKYMADALEDVIVGLQQKGYEIVPVSELIYKEDYHLTVVGRQIKD